MDFFDLLKMVGGLALFLYGMNLLGDGLSQASGGRSGAYPGETDQQPDQGSA